MLFDTRGRRHAPTASIKYVEYCTSHDHSINQESRKRNLKKLILQLSNCRISRKKCRQLSPVAGALHLHNEMTLLDKGTQNLISTAGTSIWQSSRRLTHSTCESIVQDAVIEPHLILSARKNKTQGAVTQTHAKCSIFRKRSLCGSGKSTTSTRMSVTVLY